MNDWSTIKSIKDILNTKWDKGYFFKHLMCGDNFFPYKIKLNYPNSGEMNLYFSDVIEWIENLRKNAKLQKGYGYEIVEHNFKNRLSGKNSLPIYVIIPTIEDGIKLINKQADISVFLENSHKLIILYPELKDWIIKKPFDVLKMQNNCEKFLKVLDWFSKHEKTQLYLRQLDIEGIDTKFIEEYKSLISDMLDVILPQEKINLNSNIFEERFYLKRKHSQIRFRILDKSLNLDGFTDLKVTISEFINWNPFIKRFFFTENEINFLSFPNVENSCVIFGKGYGIELFKLVLWLQEKEVYYWGDIDTHGFNILSTARSFLPQIQSFLMTEEVLLAHRALWVKEDKQVTFSINRLNNEEYNLACRLQGNYWGEGVRLEQERIGFSYVNKFVQSLVCSKD